MRLAKKPQRGGDHRTAPAATHTDTSLGLVLRDLTLLGPVMLFASTVLLCSYIFFL